VGRGDQYVSRADQSGKHSHQFWGDLFDSSGAERDKRLSQATRFRSEFEDPPRLRNVVVPDETQSVPVLMEKGSLVEAAGGRRTVLEVDDVLKVGRLGQD
jgi:hypothetical protein